MRTAAVLALVAVLVPAPSPLKGDARSEAAATHRAEVMLDRVVVPGGVRETSFPYGTATIDEPFPVPVELARRWVVTGDRETLIHAFRLHPPRGFAASGPTFHLPPVAGYPGSTNFSLLPGDRPQSQMQELDLTAKDLGGGKVELTAQATVAWIPPRSKAETLPAVVTSGSFVLYADQPVPPVRRATRPADTVRLGRALNELPTTHQLARLDCPSAGAVVLLTLRTPSHVRIYRVPLAGCPFIRVTVDGDRQPDLAASAGLRSLLKALTS